MIPVLSIEVKIVFIVYDTPTLGTIDLMVRFKITSIVADLETGRGRGRGRG